MFIVLINAIMLFFRAIEILVLIRCVLSFIAQGQRGNLFTDIIYQMTDPLLIPIREAMYKLNINTGMIDFSPIILFFLLNILRRVIIGILI